MVEINVNSLYPGREPLKFDIKDLNRPEKLFLASSLIAESNYSDEDEVVSPEVEALAEKMTSEAKLQDRLDSALAILSTVETETWGG